MRVFPADPSLPKAGLRIAAGLILAVGLNVSANAQVAQDAPESQILPELPPSAVGEPIQLAPPTTLLPEGDDAATGGDPADPEAAPDIEGIEVSRLNELDPESVGVLDPEHGGFGGDLWRGTDRRTVERLLPRLPGALGSVTMRQLARRLLLSNAAPPAAQPGDAADRGTNLLALRVGRLAAMGDFEGLSALLEVAPQRYDNEAVARARVETLFLDGQGEAACKEVRFRVAEYEASVYWRKALVFCQILRQDADGASLGLALLREEGAAATDPVFFLLADSLTGLREEAPDAAPASALHLAMLQASGRPLPVELIDSASPGLAVLLARASGNSLADRTNAAERAVRLGLLAPEQVAALYLEYTFDAEQRANAISSAEQLSGVEQRALFYQAAYRQEVPAARAELLNVALRAAREEGSYALMAVVLLPLIADIPLQPELAWFAETAGRALYAAGRFEQAGAWLALARQESLIDTQAAMAVAALWPYSRLSGATSLAWKGGLTTWAEAQPARSAEEIAERQLVLRVAFQALGQTDSLVWSDLVGAQMTDQSTAAAPDAALLYALSEASQLGRLGETVLLALLALGEQGPGDVHPLVLHEVLQALARVQLTYEARLLAIEAAVANGI